ncbi:Plastid division protein PDV2 [Dichanthelium oligosanthes]|uniref:Plastid division protein PDV2 n=1 Tax=Dichanthelium oligosanthes TaxID=888268 RepID=A0A1E5VJ31_9POAL|nr:Plastid division protein PDV2 [Dichanthelium oligosanthes]
MEGEEIGLVLARASELRSRISAAARTEEAVKRLGAAGEDEEEQGEEQEEEMESLVGISEALESLERQLASLQDLQHQQRYERETILSQIDRSRRSLLGKLKEYKGQDCEVIHEAAAFAGEKIEHDDGLILPPYSNHVTNSFVLDDLYPLNYVSKPKCLHNGLGSDGMVQDVTRTNGLENRNTGTSNRSLLGGIGSFIGWMAKTAVMVVGAVSIMKGAGYEPVIGTNSIKLDISGLFGKTSTSREDQSGRRCPPGQVMVLEDGRAHCVVKERVEVPFGTNLASPDASYGLG